MDDSYSEFSKKSITYMKSLKQRNSAFELLRIVAMFFITLHHNLVYGIGVCGYGGAASNVPHQDSIPVLDDILNGICIIGVNLFILLTGWFGVRSIKASMMRILNAYLVCVCFFAIERSSFEKSIWDMSNWWFLPNFTILLLLSPLIESSIKGINLKKYSYFIALLTIVNILFGYHWMYGNSDGFNFLNFVFLYYIARYLRLLYESNNKVVCFASRYGWLLFLMCAVIVGLLHTWKFQYYGEGSRLWSYNNPLVIVESCCLFLWFAKLNISSGFINFLASGTFTVYLLTSKGAIDFSIFPFASRIYLSYSYIGLIAYSVIICALFYIPCSIVITILHRFQYYFPFHKQIENK